ncbi:MAG TPA: ComEC/Rec2 family competence protein [Ktedonobacteraceae bacterium]
MIKSKSITPELRGLTLVIATVAWLAGILLAYWISLSSLLLLILATAALLCLIFFWSSVQARILMLITLGLLLGAWRYTVASPLGDVHAISASIGIGTLELQGNVSDEPKLEGKIRVLLVAVSAISKNGGASWQNAHGLVEVEALGSAVEDPYGANYGDNVELRGKLQAPLPNATPDIFASMIFPRIAVSGAGGNPVIAALYHLRITLAAVISRSLPQPEAALLTAILLGLRTPALKPLTAAFNNTGTTHLIVPSGFKVTILGGLILAGTRWLHTKPGDQGTALLPAQKRRYNRRRWFTSAAIISAIAVYTVLSGGGPAALRAGIMGALLVIAPRFGRTYNFYTALAACTFMLSIIDPFVLWDVGFLLSFLGTLGIVMLTPLLQRVLKSIEHLPFGHYIADISAVTIAAQVATFPIVAISFKEISFIAPIANILTVPLLGIIIFLGVLICVTGMFLAPLGMLCGWVAWPVLWYIDKIVTACSILPGAFINVNDVNTGLAWCYYVLLCLVIGTINYKWPAERKQNHAATPALLSRRTWFIVYLSATLVVILATGATALAAKSDGKTTISFLNVGPTNQQPQGEAVLIQTPDKTALIDGGIDATSLAQELDSRLPSWQRTIDVVISTTQKADHLAGLQDVITRFQVGEVIDAGMLHPSARYALLRRTISERNLRYVEIRQGATIAVGSQVALQVFWPRSSLHKGGNEEVDNGLIVRLIAPGLRLLFLGASAMSKYALNGLLSDIAPDYLQAEIVQVVAEVGKAFPTELSDLLQEVKPSVIVITPAALSAKQRKDSMASVINPLPSALSRGATWQIEQTAQVGTIEFNCSNRRWSMNV